MKAVVLAGGAGTRLRPLTYVVPKCMLPVGGKPLLERTIKYLKTFGFYDFVVCVAYLKKQIIDAFGDGTSLGVRIEYAEAESPLGTGGQLKTAEKYVADTFLALNGDVVTSMNVGNLLKTQREKDGAGTIALKKFEVKIPYGYVTTSPTSLIKNFSEKPTLQFLANAGFYVFKQKIFDYIPTGEVCSLETEVFPSMIKKGEKIYSYYEDAYWNDVGTMVDFERVNDEILSNAPVKFQQE